MTKQDDGSLKRLGGGRWQTRDGRWTIESGSGRWMVVDAEQTDDFGLPLARGPYGSLTEAKAAIESFRGAPAAVSPLEARLADARRARRSGGGGGAGKAGESSSNEPEGAERAPEPEPARERDRSPLVPSKLRRVLVVGHASWNTMVRLESFPKPRPATIHPLGWHEAVGSSGAGKAIALVRLGVPVTLIAPLGNDDAGRRVRAALGAVEGLELRAVLDPSGTARHVNLIDAAGGRQSYVLHTGDDRVAPETTVLDRAIRAADVVLLERTAIARAALPAVRRLRRPIWTDLHDWDGEADSPLLDAADVATLSTDALADPRPAMERAIEAGRRLVVATRGADGAVALDETGAWLEVPAATAGDIVDPNGAGDAFAAALLLGLALGQSVAEALATAARAGAVALASADLSGEALTRRAVLGPAAAD